MFDVGGGPIGDGSSALPRSHDRLSRPNLTGDSFGFLRKCKTHSLGSSNMVEHGLGNSLLWYHDVLPAFLATLGSDFYDIRFAGVVRSNHGVYLGFDQDMYIRLSHHRLETYIFYISKPQIPFNTHRLSRPFTFNQLILH